MSSALQLLRSPALWLALLMAGLGLAWAGSGLREQVAAAGRQQGVKENAVEESSVFASPSGTASKSSAGLTELPAQPPIDVAQPQKFETASFALG